MTVAWPTMLYLLVFGLFLLPVIPALREVRQRRDAKPLQVVRQHDTNIRHFAYSFRSQLQTLFAKYRLDPLRPPASFEGFWKDDERFQFIGVGEEFRGDEAEIRSRIVRRLIVGASAIRLPDHHVFEQEVFSLGPIDCGEGSTLRAVMSDVDITLGRDCTVARWLHADRKVEISPGGRIYGRCSANATIVLHAGTEFQRLNAPLIRTGHSEVPAPSPIRERQHYELPKAAFELDERTSLVDGSIRAPERCAIARNLISTATLEIGPGSLVDGSLKGRRLVRIGSGCVVRGSVVSEGDIDVEPGCIIGGPLIAEGRISIGSGCVIGTRALETSVSAPHITLAAGSRFSGTVWATKIGQVVT